MSESETEELESNFDLSGNMDEVDDVPEFMNPTNGQHVFSIPSAKITVKDSVQSVRIMYQLRQTIELANPEEASTPIGSIWSEQFGAKGVTFLKQRLKSLLGEDNIKGISIPDMLTQLETYFTQEANFTAVTKSTTSKPNDKGQVFDNVRMSSIVPCELVALPEGVAEFKAKAA